MPHLTIQHTTNIKIDNPNNFLNVLNQSLWESGEFKKPEELKSRIIPLSEFLVGTNQQLPNNQRTGGFIFLHLKVMSGRNNTIKQQLSEALASSAKNFLASQTTQYQTLKKIQICVEIDELSTSYHKIML